MNCNFSQPVNYQGVAPKEKESFAFSQMTCTDITSTGSNIEEIAGVGNFWISKQLDYGQVLILTFLLIFFVGFVVKFCWNFAKQDTNQKL